MLQLTNWPHWAPWSSTFRYWDTLTLTFFLASAKKWCKVCLMFSFWCFGDFLIFWVSLCVFMSRHPFCLVSDDSMDPVFIVRLLRLCMNAETNSSLPYPQLLQQGWIVARSCLIYLASSYQSVELTQNKMPWRKILFLRGGFFCRQLCYVLFCCLFYAAGFFLYLCM